MSRNVLVTVGAMVLALVVATPAKSDVRYPGQRPAVEWELGAMLVVANTYWDRRGASLPCPAVALDVASDLRGPDSLGDVLGRGYSPLFGHADCRIVLDDFHVGQNLARLHGRRRDRFTRLYSAARLCQTVVHETGHVRGLPHGDGIMREDVWKVSRWEDMPGECRRLARSLV